MLELLKYSPVFILTILGAIAIAYLYFSADIFSDVLKKPIHIVSWGIMLIDIGVLLVVLVSYESTRGIDPAVFGIPLSSLFYAFYIIGSILIIFGSRQFTHRNN